MGRQIPKNVRQIGNVSDSSKIYIEDYVDIFLNQLCEKTSDNYAGAFLVGELNETDDTDCIYVNGAIKMQELAVKGKDFIIEEMVWQKACETCKEFFGDSEILGWVVVGGDKPFEMTHQIQKMHQKYFRREKSIVAAKNGRDKDEKFFIYKYKEMLEINGHYIYYEKNKEMQDYMIFCRKNSGMSPGEVIEDKAAQSFRSIIHEKMEKKEKRTKFRMMYVASVCCAVIVLGAVGGLYFQENLKEEEIEELEELEVVEEIVVDIPEVIPNEMQQEIPDNTQEVSNADLDIQMEEVYVVKKGDTLAAISKELYGDIYHVSEICEMNGLEDGNLIFIGQKLLLP